MSEPALTLEQAAVLAGRYTELQGSIGSIEAKRKARIAKVATIADAKVAPLVTERDDIVGKLKAWFETLGPDLLKGKKSIELAGATLGKRDGNATLVTPEDDKPAIASLLRRKWGKLLLRTKPELNKTLIKAALQGANKKALTGLGFKVTTPTYFYIDTAAATIGAGDRAVQAQ